MSPTQLVVIIAVAIIAALLKSITGLGYPLLLIPALALIVDIVDAIVIVAPSNFILNVWIAGTNRAQLPAARTLKPFVATGIVGTVIGTLLLPLLPDRGLRIALIVIIVAFLLDRARQARATEDSVGGTVSDKLAPLAGFFAGMFQGTTGVAAPVVSVWFLSRQLAVDAFVFAVTMSFTVVGLVQIVILLFQPDFADELLLGLILVPFTLLTVPAGAFIRARLDTSRFEQLVVAVLIAAAISLLTRVF